MAEIQFENAKSFRDLDQIASALRGCGVTLAAWSIPEDQSLRSLLQKTVLTELEKEQVLAVFEPRFNQLKGDFGIQSRDLVVLSEETENLENLLQMFSDCHTHDDDEIRYIIDGEGVFGFVLPDRSQVKLLLEPGEFISVPKNTEHWFELTPNKRVKAVRYFSNKEAWTPHYTKTSRRL